MKKQSFVFGTLLLALSGVVCKILGAIYKIPLTNILGTQGVGIYYVIFPIYVFMLTFASNSFTVALSRKVSVCVAQNEPLHAYKTFKATLILLCVLGLIGAILLAVFSRVIAMLQGLENAYVGYIAIAPAIFFVAVSSAFKGYFQGLQNMFPTALSQVVEQIAKLLVGFLLASLLIGRSVVYGTVGALLGVTISEGISCLFFIGYFFVFKHKYHHYFKFSKSLPKERTLRLKPIMSEIFKSTIPLTLSSVILPMSMVIDSFLIINILKSMQFDKLFATRLLGLTSGIVNTLIGLPSTLSVAICMTIVPFITFALSKNDYDSISEKTALSIKLTLLICVPCVFAFSLFAPYFIKLLYAHSFDSVYEFNVASSLLVVSGINVLYLSFLQITTSLLQAINKSYVPVISLSVALVFKVIFEVVLINVPMLNIAGAVISNSVCYFLSSGINVYFFKKHVPLKFSFYQTIVCPVVAALSMSGVVVLSISILKNYLSFVGSTILSFVMGVVIYLGLLIVLKAFSEKEQRALFFWRTKRNRASN